MSEHCPKDLWKFKKCSEIPLCMVHNNFYNTVRLHNSHTEISTWSDLNTDVDVCIQYDMVVF